jgi:hypothetical protein
MILSGSAAAAAIGLINSQLRNSVDLLDLSRPIIALFFGSGDRVISHRPTSGRL